MDSVHLDIADSLRSKLDELDAQHTQLEQNLSDPEVLTDHRKVRDLSIKKSALDPVAQGWRRIKQIESEITELREAASLGTDPVLAELAQEEIPELQSEALRLIEDVKSTLVTADDRSIGSVIMEIRAGTGGDEAGLWARDLLGVYEKYVKNKGWKLELLDVSEDAGAGGLRSAVVSVKGDGVWSELAFEAGVHSVKRVPETETQGRIHTSTCTVAVLPEPEDIEIHVDWGNDVEEHVTTAQGPGGQNVNKVATAVHMVHKPTGVEVRMQETKSQAQNREKAKRLLAARVAEIERQKADAERAESRRSQIGAGERSEKIRVYRYQDGIVADQRLTEKFNLRDVLEGKLAPLYEALIEQETARRLAEL